MIIALAGRRIDAEGAAHSRFPAAHVELVAARLRSLLLAKHVTTLVCSAACGADLLALEVAPDLGIRRRVVLPFPQLHFRGVSVLDRPGNWGARFDAIMHELAADVLELGCQAEDPAAFRTANDAILNEALSLGNKTPAAVEAVVVWDGCGSGPNDATLHFRDEARRRGLPIHEILTL